jgi:hypothetical protein
MRCPDESWESGHPQDIHTVTEICEGTSETTTTQPATTTTTLPFIRTGTYAVPDEVAPGTYRH